MSSSTKIKSEKVDTDRKTIEQDGEDETKNDSSVHYTKKVRRYPKTNLDIPRLTDRAEKRRAIEQSDSDDETPEERIRRIHTEYKHRYRLRLDAEMMFDLGLNNKTQTSNKKSKIKGDTSDSV